MPPDWGGCGGCREEYHKRDMLTPCETEKGCRWKDDKQLRYPLVDLLPANIEAFNFVSRMNLIGETLAIELTDMELSPREAECFARKIELIREAERKNLERKRAEQRWQNR
jgi:hypothetical protein